jgi:hypothetical protein
MPRFGQGPSAGQGSWGMRGGAALASTAAAAPLRVFSIEALKKHVGLEVDYKGLEVGDHTLCRRPSTYAAHANKFVSEPFQKEQCSNMRCYIQKYNTKGVI